MDMWFRTLPGSVIVDFALKELDQLLPYIPGEIAVQLGGPCNLRLLQRSKMSQVFYCSDHQMFKGDDASMRCSFNSLPIESNSVNLVLVAYALEFSDNPEQLLKEAFRILRPGGQVIVLGFNRWSWWSLWRLSKGKHDYPWSGRFQSIWQVKQWLNKIGYGVLANKSFCFVGPHKKHPPNSWLHLSEVLGQVLIPKRGAVYLINAQKKVAGTTPLATIWRSKKRARPKSVVVRPLT